MRRTPLKRGKPLRASKPINPVSPKRRSQKDEYAALKAKLVKHPTSRCGVCRGPYPEDIHHRREMSMGGAWTNPSNCIGVHRTCHEAIHDNPGRGDWPNTRGLLVFSGDPEWDDLGERAWRLRDV